MYSENLGRKRMPTETRDDHPIPSDVDAILDTVENFLETCPAVEDEDLVFGPRVWDETLGAWVQSITIGEVRWNIVIARGV